MKLVVYARVSTDGQAADGDGLAVQEEGCRAWAKANGHQVVAVCTDIASGTADLQTRDGLASVLDHLGNGADGVVLHRLDRLARDLVVQETLLRELFRLGSVFSTSAGEAGVLVDDPDDPSRKLIRTVLGAVAAYERELIGLRMRAGRKRKRDAGGYAGGAPPFGYVTDGSGDLIVCPSEHEVLMRIETMRVNGTGLRQIAEMLNAEGVPTKRGGLWHPTTVARLVSPESRLRDRQRATRRRLVDSARPL